MNLGYETKEIDNQPTSVGNILVQLWFMASTHKLGVVSDYLIVWEIG